jgi:intracellular sulfur oxidation DsrE/DsrF family protein
MTRRLAAVTASLFLLPVAVLAQQAAPTAAPVPPSQKILIHVHSNDPKDWQASVDKANSIMSTASKGSTVVEILATGDGLKLINKDDSNAPIVTGSLDKDVSFVACHASMKANHMEISQLHSGVGTVPSGGREMAMKKAEGWTVMDDKDLK